MPNARQKPAPVSLSRKVVFLHIAKTAGTSIVHFFRQRLPADAICSHGDFLGFARQRQEFLQQLGQYQFISGHFGFDDVAPLLPQAYSFTFLRDPVDRVLSLYKFCMHEDMQRQFAVARAANELGLEGFLVSRLPEVCEMLDNQQTWQLARNYWRQDRAALAHLSPDELFELASAHLQQFSHVGLTETFDEDFSRILQDLEVREPVPLARQFKTPDPVNRTELSRQALQQLQLRLALDYRLIDEVRAGRAKAGGGQSSGN